MKIVVTGGTGFLGTHLVSALRAERHEVLVASRRTGCDITSSEEVNRALEGADVVFHLAALVQSRPGAFDQINVEGLRNLVDASEHHGISRLIYVSSFTIFGPSGSQPHSEQTIPERSSFFHGYDESKYNAFRLARELSNRVPLNIVFPTVIYGPGPLTEGNILVRLLSRWLKTRLATLPVDGRPVWNFVFVTDVVRGLIAIWKHAEPGEDFILGGEDISLRRLAGSVESASGRRLLKVGLSPWALQKAAKLEGLLSKLTGNEPLLVPETVPFFLNDWRFDSGKAARLIDYRPRTTEQGLAETLPWMANEKLC